VFKMNFTSSNDIFLLNIWEIIWSLNKILLQVTAEPLYKGSEKNMWHQHFGSMNTHHHTRSANFLWENNAFPLIQLIMSVLKTKRQASTCLSWPPNYASNWPPLYGANWPPENRYLTISKIAAKKPRLTPGSTMWTILAARPRNIQSQNGNWSPTTPPGKLS
jgi:hypothetical protein